MVIGQPNVDLMLHRCSCLPPEDNDLRGDAGRRSGEARVWHRRHDAGSLSVLRGLTYALGIGGNEEMLAAIRAGPLMPAAPRAAARWWLNIPAAVYASAAN